MANFHSWLKMINEAGKHSLILYSEKAFKVMNNKQAEEDDSVVNSYSCVVVGCAIEN